MADGKLSKEGQYLLGQLVAVFGNSRAQKQDAPKPSIISATLDDVEGIDPFVQTPDTFRKLFPIVLAVGLRSEADERTPSVLHHFLWPLFSDSTLYEIKDFKENEKLIIWQCVEHIYQNILGVGDDPYWLENSGTVQSKILNA